MVRYFKQNAMLFSVGGLAYAVLELLWRQRTHWTMIITGGICFLALFRIFKRLKNIKLIYKCFIGSSVITAIELVVGVIVNIQLKMDVWDYSSMPFNLWGQICPVYSLLWFGLTIPILFACKKMQGIVEYL